MWQVKMAAAVVAVAAAVQPSQAEELKAEVV